MRTFVMSKNSEINYNIKKGLIMKFLLYFIILTTFILWSDNLSAKCTCTCVNGENQALCDNSIDLKPICPLTICPIVPFSIKPLKLPSIPPIGASSCTQKQVLDPQTRRYEWKEICS